MDAVDSCFFINRSTGPQEYRGVVDVVERGRRETEIINISFCSADVSSAVHGWQVEVL